MGRAGYQAWMAHLTKGLQDPVFLLKFEATIDPWERSKLVGQKISELRKSFRALTEEQREELAKQAEVELRTGLELMGKDKKTIQELIALVDPPKNK
jgi:predicted phage gp36 major capsid-like protein